MAKSYNGWSASPTLKTRVIEPVRGVRLRVRDNDNIAFVFTYLVQQYHARVDDVTGPHKADDWGFAYRKNRNAGNLSTHASATAVDLDAVEHPNGVPTLKTFTQAQVREINAILRELEGVIAWGGNFRITPDAMHFEIAVRPGTGKIYRVAKKLRKKLAMEAKVKAKVSTPTKKSIDTVAKEVIQGKWGTGLVRKTRLKKAGYDYAKVQSAVKKMLK